MSHATEQEAFWEGDFGNDYADRNCGAGWVAANLSIFSKIFAGTSNLQRVLELGSNIGLNLMAIRQLLPSAELSAVEINRKAVDELKKNVPNVGVHLNSILEFSPLSTWDLVFTKGVLIHINPDRLPDVYDLMYKASSRYILVCEYYNPRPVEIAYRGHSGKLFKRDFAGDILDRFRMFDLLTTDLSITEIRIFHRTT